MIGLAAATGAGYLLLPDQWPAQLFGFILIVSWLIWSIAPVLSFNVNEGLDPTRLLIYPITRRDFLAHLLLGTLLDYPTYFFLPFLLAIIIGFGLGLTLPIVLAALFLCYLLMVLTSQTIINTLGGVLRSRRFRDISMVVGAFVGLGCWLISSSFQGVIENFFDGEPGELEQFFAGWQPLDILKWLPPGAAAKAIEQAAVGAWGVSLLWLGYTVLWVVVVAWLWWRVTYRIVTGEGFVFGGAITAEQAKSTKSVGQTKKRRLSWDWIPADIRVIAAKDLKLSGAPPKVGLVWFICICCPSLRWPIRSFSISLMRAIVCLPS
jgi:ABC-2 type transport system permease protein